MSAAAKASPTFSLEKSESRLAVLVDAKLAELEKQTKAGKLPSVAELNGARRLVEQARMAAEDRRIRELTTNRPRG